MNYDAIRTRADWFRANKGAGDTVTAAGLAAAAIASADDVPALLAEIDRQAKRIHEAHDALTRIDDGDDDAFTTLESTIEYITRNYRAVVKDANELYEENKRLRALVDIRGES